MPHWAAPCMRGATIRAGRAKSSGRERSLICSGSSRAAPMAPDSAAKKIPGVQKVVVLDDLVAVIGDFNDTPESKSIQTVIGSGPTAMWSAMTDLGPNPKFITYNEGDFKSIIDFMLCTPAMHERFMNPSLPRPARIAFNKIDAQKQSVFPLSRAKAINV